MTKKLSLPRSIVRTYNPVFSESSSWMCLVRSNPSPDEGVCEEAIGKSATNFGLKSVKVIHLATCPALGA